MQKLAVLISGSGSNLQAILDAIRSGLIKNGEVVLVVSNKADAYGLVRAEKAGLPWLTLDPKDYKGRLEYDQALAQALLDAHCDLVILAGFMRILGPDFIRTFEGRILNIHPSLIPAFSGPGFYGLKVHEAALKAGVKLSGATVHLVNEVCDGGKILAQEAIEVLPDDSPESLQARILNELEHKLYPRVIEEYCKVMEAKHGGEENESL